MTASLRYRLCLCAAAITAAFGTFAQAHEVRPAHLDIAETAPDRYVVRWKVPALGENRLAIDPVFDSACTMATEAAEGAASGAVTRTWQIQCPDGLAGKTIAFSNLSRTMVDVLVQIRFQDGRAYTGLVRPSAPTFEIPAKDTDSKVFASYLRLGVEHILFGWDHLLFVLGMMLLVTSRSRLVWAITGFTIAHSLTLALAMLDVIRVPGPPVEAVIALSIVLLAVEARRYRKTAEETFAIRAPWAVSGLIGLVHGLGFAGALSEYGLPPYARLASLFAFNLGVEIGQLAVVGGVLVWAPLIRKSDARVAPAIRWATAWGIGVCGSFWLMQRVAGFYI